MILIIFFLLLFSPIHCQEADQTARDPNGSFNQGQILVARANKLSVRQSLFYQEFETRKSYTIIETNAVYGLNEIFGLEVIVPIALKLKKDDRVSRGLLDTFILGQANFLLQPHDLFVFKAGLKLPTGSKDDPLLLGTGSIDLAGEFAHIHSAPTWFVNTAVTALFSCKKNDRRIGSIYRSFFTIGPKMNFQAAGGTTILLAGQAKIIHAQKDKYSGIKDPNSGHSVLFAGPFISVRHNNNEHIFEWFFEVPIWQNRHGNQKRVHYRTNVSFQFQIKF